MEAEAYRRTIEPLIGERLDRIELRDERLLRQGDESPAAIGGMIGGASISAVRRIGKAVLVDVDSGHVVALAFGQRGSLTLDGHVARANGDGWRPRAMTPETATDWMTAIRGTPTP